MNKTLGGFNEKTILITGGTGSFGKAFLKFLIKKHKPKKVIIFSRDELKQYNLSQNLKNDNVRFFLGDVRDKDRLLRALNNVDLVVHAAALKQVVAAEYNPTETIQTNITGAENLINTSIDQGVKKVLALSTDKAVNPINLYGATKLCSDKLFIAGNALSGKNGTKFSIVRYGNVLGSRGSVVNIFKEQVKNKLIQLTDPKMTRFILTIEEAINFVSFCFSLMKGKEIFIPKIPSVKIINLAEAIGKECKIKFMGKRPGEKLHESMIPSDESDKTLEYKKFYIIFQQLAKEYIDQKYNNEKGCELKDSFSYDSRNNTDWLSKKDISKLLKNVD